MARITADVGSRLGSPFIVVAASDADEITRAFADYKCDGIADEVQIQAAIDALPSDGGTVILSEGNFTLENSQTGRFGVLAITGTKPIPSVTPIRILGQGRATFLTVSGDRELFDLEHAENIEIGYMRLENTGTVETVGVGDCIDADTTRNCEFHHLWITYAKGRGIIVDGKDVTGRLSNHNMIHHNYFEGCQLGTIDVLVSDHNDISHNRLEVVDGVPGINLRTGGGAIENSLYNRIAFNDINDGTRSIYINEASYNTIIGNVCRDATSAAIRLEDATYNIVQGNELVEGDGASMNYGVREVDACDFNVIEGNLIKGALTAPIVRVGADSIVRNNYGHVTEASGTATLLNGQTSIVVTHGLDVTPVAGDIMVTPIESLATATEFYIDTYTATQFTINVDVDPTQDVDFAWKAMVL